MGKYKIRITDNTLINLIGITDFIEFENLQRENSIKVGKTIWAAIDDVSLNPYSFKECLYIPTKSKMYRQTLCLSWYIIFRITEDEIVVLGIIHSARKPSSIKKLRSIK